MEKHDLIILGAGPAGITASIYAARKKLDFIIISQDIGRFYKDMDNYLLISITEKRTKKEIEDLVKALEEIVCS